MCVCVSQGWANVAQEEMVDEYVALAQDQLNTIKLMMAKGEHINKQVTAHTHAHTRTHTQTLVPYVPHCMYWVKLTSSTATRGTTH